MVLAVVFVVCAVICAALFHYMGQRWALGVVAAGMLGPIAVLLAVGFAIKYRVSRSEPRARPQMPPS